MPSQSKTHLEGTEQWVNNALLRHLLAVMAEHGFAAQRLCQGLGIHPQEIEQAGTYSSYQQARQLIVRCQRVLPSPLLGMWVGQKQTLLSMGVAGVAVLAAKDWVSALRVAIQFPHQVGSLLRYSLESRDKTLIFRATPSVRDKEIESFSVSKSFVGVLRTAHLIGGVGGFKVRQAYISNDDAALHQELERLFDCPLQYRPETNEITIELMHKAQVLPTHDPLVFNHSLYLLEQQEQKLRQKRGFSAEVENAIRTLWLTHGHETGYAPSAEEVAQTLCMGSRTLRRKLALCNSSFQAVLEQHRKAKALELLSAASAPSLRTIAQQTGYQDERSLRRAFIRWMGVPPGQFRKEMN